MPLYVFACKKHGQFEHIVSLGRLDAFIAKCPSCNYKTKTRELTHAGEVRLVGGSGGFTGSKGNNARIVTKRVGS
jgi:putative FmdB family regulatory protein